MSGILSIAILENLQKNIQSKSIIIDEEPANAFNNLQIKDSKISDRVIRIKGLFGGKRDLQKNRDRSSIEEFSEIQVKPFSFIKSSC